MGAWFAVLVGEEVSRRLARFQRSGPSRGQGLVEYGLILLGIALVATVALVFFGDLVARALDIIANAIDQATT